MEHDKKMRVKQLEESLKEWEKRLDVEEKKIDEVERRLQSRKERIVKYQSDLESIDKYLSKFTSLIPKYEEISKKGQNNSEIDMLYPIKVIYQKDQELNGISGYKYDDITSLIKAICLYNCQIENLTQQALIYRIIGESEEQEEQCYYDSN